MKKITLWLSMMTFTFFATMQVAEAKRFGGGGSFGYSKKMAPKQYNTSPKQAAQPAAANKPAAAGAKTSGASRFLGPLAGIAAGGLLAAMLFGDGFEGIQLLDILLIALLAFILFSLFRRRAGAQSTAYSGHSGQAAASSSQAPFQTREAAVMDQAIVSPSGGSIIGSALSETAEPVLVKPDWFDEARFVEDAKSHFVAVQKAWDALDAKELQDYCTPELYKALQTEMAQLQAGTNHTEVDELNAEIADIAQDGDYLIVSVRFTGFIKEERDGFAHAFNEIWHIRRLAQGRGPWQIAGIQQNEL